MSEIYADIQISPRKKRHPPEFDDGNTFTPKKLRNVRSTPPSRSICSYKQLDLPSHLRRLSTIHSAIQHALSHALATCAVSPTSDTGVVRNVLNHLSLNTYTGLTTQFHVDDLRRLCWLWEWDGETAPEEGKEEKEEEEENPFLTKDSSASVLTEWTRGAMGLVISSTSHYSKKDRKRVPAYGIGIEVEINIDKDMAGGMAAVARWTSAAESRRSEFRAKLEKWAQLHRDSPSVPLIPLADLPKLVATAKVSALTRTLATASPKGANALASLPASVSIPRSPTKSPVKHVVRELALPFPKTPSTSTTPSKSSILFPKTPSRHAKTEMSSSLKPVDSLAEESAFNPSTPVHQRGNIATTVPQTPTSSRRQALYERVRQRSMTSTPAKASSSEATGSKLTKDKIIKMGQEEMRRRCLLGRLGSVAESVWMLFSTPVMGSSATPTSRKRRALPTSEVATAVIKSSPVPISSAEAMESLSMLTKLCPFFVREVNIAGVEWLEMPSTQGCLNSEKPEGSPTKTPAPPPSPGKLTSAQELVTRSPRRVKREVGGLREVREIIRKELELQD